MISARYSALVFPRVVDLGLLSGQGGEGVQRPGPLSGRGKAPSMNATVSITLTIRLIVFHSPGYFCVLHYTRGDCATKAIWRISHMDFTQARVARKKGRAPLPKRAPKGMRGVSFTGCSAPRSARPCPACLSCSCLRASIRPHTRSSGRSGRGRPPCGSARAVPGCSSALRLPRRRAGG